MPKKTTKAGTVKIKASIVLFQIVVKIKSVVMSAFLGGIFTIKFNLPLLVLTL